MNADCIAVTVMMADLVLHQFFSWKRQSGFGSRNCHVAEVLCWDFFWPVDTGIFFTNAGCNTLIWHTPGM